MCCHTGIVCSHQEVVKTSAGTAVEGSRAMVGLSELGAIVGLVGSQVIVGSWHTEEQA